jgi:hypothetical protein
MIRKFGLDFKPFKARLAHNLGINGAKVGANIVPTL